MNLKNQLNALHNLEVVKEILDREDILFWLDFGTLLTAYRDGDLEYEHDTDISIFVRDYALVRRLEGELKARLGRFDSFAFNVGNNPFYHAWGSETVVHGDVLYWYPLGDYYVCWGVNLPFSVPKHFFESFRTVKFWKLSDTEFSVPAETEEYLKWVFGEEDWKTPMSGSQYSKIQKDVLEGLSEPYPVNRPLPDVLEWKRRFFNNGFEGSRYWLHPIMLR